MAGEIFTIGGLVLVLTLVAMALGFGILKVLGEGKEV
ncbi:MAG: cytochrome b6-f complex subunit 7 [Gemmatimonadaceae bacterium]|nr:cytochrome b6-f complex subunit 7 [Gloeobacterales cyanobacterium ES-bin-141]